MINSLVSRWADKLRTPRAILHISPYQLDNITPPSKNSRQLQVVSPYASTSEIWLSVPHSLPRLPFSVSSQYTAQSLPRSHAGPPKSGKSPGEISPAQLRSRPETIRCQIATEKPPALNLQTSNCTDNLGHGPTCTYR